MRNLNVAVREWEDQVVFLHRIVEGGTDRSYGIHVARLAGVPSPVLDRARQLLSELAVHHVSHTRALRNPQGRGRESDSTCSAILRKNCSRAGERGGRPA